MFLGIVFENIFAEFKIYLLFIFVNVFLKTGYQLFKPSGLGGLKTLCLRFKQVKQEVQGLVLLT